jgi:hypothetical protein
MDSESKANTWVGIKSVLGVSNIFEEFIFTCKLLELEEVL